MKEVVVKRRIPEEEAGEEQHSWKVCPCPKCTGSRKSFTAVTIGPIALLTNMYIWHPVMGFVGSAIFGLAFTFAVLYLVWLACEKK